MTGFYKIVAMSGFQKRQVLNLAKFKADLEIPSVKKTTPFEKVIAKILADKTVAAAYIAHVENYSHQSARYPGIIKDRVCTIYALLIRVPKGAARTDF